ncbi:hypothetical protein SELMODRAFT_928, partial [Selaginella moellendorffii]
GLPLVVALNCLEDWQILNADALAGIATLEHLNLAQIAEGKLETAAAVIIHSLAYLPRAAQRRLQPWQLILCLGSIDKPADSTAAAEMGLKLVHVDCGRGEEIADTVMALLLGLLRHTHSLSAQGFASAGWLGSIQPLCKGMRRCRGLVMGIVGRTPSACALAVRCLAFKMRVIYYETEEVKEQTRKSFPAFATKVESLNELLSQSDVVSLHCPLTNDTVQIINAEALQYIKPGAIIVNSSSCHLLDDCAVKQALIDGIIAGCALDGVEGPQWLEAWVREMSNVLILPRSADYSDDAWNEIRLKAFSLLRSYLVNGVIPASSVSEDEEDWQEEKHERFERESAKEDDQWIADSQTGQQFHRKQLVYPPQEIREARSMYNKSGKKSKKRGSRRKSHQVPESFPVPERDANWVALQRDDPGGTSGRDQAVNSTSRFTSPDDSKARREDADVSSEKPASESVQDLQAIDVLKEGYVVAVRPVTGNGYYVARQKGPGRRWCLDVMSDVTPRDPAAQFLVVLRNRDRLGLRSLAAGGKLLQSNKKSELVFLNHNFDMWESWVLEGSQLSDCTLVNSKFRGVSMDVSMEVLAAVGEDDGVARWLS